VLGELNVFGPLGGANRIIAAGKSTGWVPWPNALGQRALNGKPKIFRGVVMACNQAA
jgi:hypothetical protein